MFLAELIKALEAMPDGIVSYGFGKPHSYRGDYSELAFEPVENAQVGDMLAFAKSALGETFTGYKGGEYKMSEYTEVWIARWGEWPGQGIGDSLLGYWLMEVTKNK